MTAELWHVAEGEDTLLSHGYTVTIAGMLTQGHGHDGEHLGVHTLTMPPHPVTNTLAAEPGA